MNWQAKLHDAGLAKDVAYLSTQVKQWDKRNVARTTFLTWTVNNDAVFLSLQCDGDLGGGRGPYCELNVCLAKTTNVGSAAAPACKAHFQHRAGSATGGVRTPPHGRSVMLASHDVPLHRSTMPALR